MTRWCWLLLLCCAGCPFIPQQKQATNEPEDVESFVVVCNTTPTPLPNPPLYCYNPAEGIVYVGGANVDGTNGWPVFDSPTRYAVKVEARAWCKSRQAAPLVCVRGLQP